MNFNNYVKFLKGTSKAFERLKHKDSNTLYFISDDNGDVSLYLGSELIKTSSSISVSNLEELNDIKFSSNLKANDILTYNGEQWINAEIPAFQGVGTTGLVPIPSQDLKNNFLRADGTWTDIASVISKDVENLVKIEIDKVGIEVLSKDVGDLKASFQQFQSEATVLKTQVGSLQTNLEELQDKVDKISVGENVDLNNYVSKIEFNSIVGDLKELNNYDENSTTNLINEINEINEKLTWQNLEEN